MQISVSIIFYVSVPDAKFEYEATQYLSIHVNALPYKQNDVVHLYSQWQPSNNVGGRPLNEATILIKID